MWLALVGVTACTPQAPKRPFAVPATAAWAGGSDGGMWVDCWRDDNDERVFSCSIFTTDAKIEAKGKFTLVDLVDGGTRPAQSPRAPMQYRGWDGHAIMLEGGRVLVR